METIIFKYLAAKRELCLPGIGKFRLSQRVAVANVSDRQLRPPVTVTQFFEEPVQEDYLLTCYVAAQLVVPEADARRQLDVYTQSLLAQLTSDGKASIAHIGSLSVQPGNNLRFVPQSIPQYLQPVAAVRAIRQDDVHLIRVGEEEKTNVEMAGLLAAQPGRKRRWWIVPLIIGAAALGYFSWQFFQTKTVANQQAIPIKTDHGSL